MEQWNKVTFKWDFSMGLPTGVLMNGRVDLGVINPQIYDPKAQEKVHGIFGIEAFSLPERDRESRKGKMVIKINGCMRSTTAPAKKAIGRLLRKEMKKLTDSNTARQFRYEPQVCEPEGDDWMDNEFTINFTMGNGEQFCDHVLYLAKAVLSVLGVHDEHGYHCGNFLLIRSSFVRMDSSWITFPHWLRAKHRLPMEGPEDKMF